MRGRSGGRRAAARTGAGSGALALDGGGGAGLDDEAFEGRLYAGVAALDGGADARLDALGDDLGAVRRALAAEPVFEGLAQGERAGKTVFGIGGEGSRDDLAELGGELGAALGRSPRSAPR